MGVAMCHLLYLGPGVPCEVQLRLRKLAVADAKWDRLDGFQRPGNHPKVPRAAQYCHGGWFPRSRVGLTASAPDDARWSHCQCGALRGRTNAYATSNVASALSSHVTLWYQQ